MRSLCPAVLGKLSVPIIVGVFDILTKASRLSDNGTKWIEFSVCPALQPL